MSSRKRQKMAERSSRKKTKAQQLEQTIQIMKRVQSLLLDACVEHGIIEVTNTPEGQEYTIKEKSLYVEAGEVNDNN